MLEPISQIFIVLHCFYVNNIFILLKYSSFVSKTENLYRDYKYNPNYRTNNNQQKFIRTYTTSSILVSSIKSKKTVTESIRYDMNNLKKTRYNINDTSVLHYLGGFFEGEGSNSVSISIGKEFKYGVNIQPVFNVTQHENGLEILLAYLNLFKDGSVLKKSGSDNI